MKKRSSNFELLRIISMLMIVCHHFSIYTDWGFENEFSQEKLFVDCFGLFGKLGVVLFVLISAYFNCQKKPDWKRITTTYFPTLTYSIGFFLLFIFFVKESIPNIENGLALKDYLKIFLPITFRSYWFVSSFIFMIAVSPFLNRLIKSLSSEAYITLLMILTIFLSFMPSIMGGVNHILNGGEATLFFLYLYLIGAFLKRKEAVLTQKWLYLLIFVLALTLLILSVFIIDMKNPSLEWIFPPNLLSEMSSPLVLIMGISLFLFIKNVSIGFNPVINLLAKTTFGVYLIHEHTYVRLYLWQTLVDGASYLKSNSLVLNSIVTCLVVFLVCSAIELVRQIIVKIIRWPFSATK